MAWGSPPRVRGKRQLLLQRQRALRLTPACAGKTSANPGELEHSAAHPRVCGENGRWPPASFRPAGSPPRVRGKRPSGPPQRRGPGLTPACAGKTGDDAGEHPCARAHPRVCGENLTPAGRFVIQGGSPPRVRGKRPRRRHAQRRRGLTPACAGKTTRCSGARNDLEAHPRVCGENLTSQANTYWVSGSPPRVRGKPRARGELAPVVRLTPACAGKTWARTSNVPGRRAHPRVCGENPLAAAEAGADRGSPPRVRGKLLPRLDVDELLGLTPACAGKTRSARRPRRTSRAHPRVCGENIHGGGQ